MKRGRYFITLLIFTILLFVGCNPAQKVEKRGGYLLVQNTIKNKNPYLPTDELEGFIQQNAIPGRLAPYFRWGVSIYENSLKGHETKLKLFKRRKFGKAPVIMDTLMVISTVDKLQMYLKNKGFYHANVTSSVKYKSKTAAVTYQINSGPPCMVTSFKYNIPDTTMYRLIMADTAKGNLRNGMIFDTYILDDDRDRIATVLRNNSYFNFSLSDIYYKADTSGDGLFARVELFLKKVKVKNTAISDSMFEISHPRYYIKNIFIIPDAHPGFSDSHYDTLVYTYFQNKNDTSSRTIHILYDKKLSLKPAFLVSSLNISNGDAYSQNMVNRTYKKLISQPIVGAANISMVTLNPEKVNPLEKQYLDCNIRLTQNKVKNFSLGTEGTNSGGRFGIGVNTSIQNRNAFRGAEVLSFKLRTSAELQGSLNNQFQEKYFLIFSTLEGGAEMSIDFPRILIPWRSKYQQSKQQGHTSLSAGAGFEFRPQYKKTISTAAWSYKWNNGERLSHIFTPIEINYIKIFPSDSFQVYLKSLTDPLFKSQYTDHLLSMIRYTFILSNLGGGSGSNQYFMRLNAETSGNIPYFFDHISQQPLTTEGYYQHFGVRYSQYVRFDVDFRKYWELRFGNRLAFRFLGGITYPYKNSESVPFEKSFWLGGANDMRGWRLRSLGPGGYIDSIPGFDKSGDIMLQTTLEHRFPIYSFLQGCLFVDAGNVWLRKKSEDFPYGEFNLSTFYKQVALDAGIGFRFDFSFFIFRLDGAIPILTPARNEDWFVKDEFKLRNSILNFGIGYPF